MAREVPNMDLDKATTILDFQSAYSICPTAVGHLGQHGSNLPCEDTWSSGSFGTPGGDPKKDWFEWGIFDGHAGPRTSDILTKFLPLAVGSSLASANCFTRKYTPNDSTIISAIKEAFQGLDRTMVEEAWEVMSGIPVFESIRPGELKQTGSTALSLAEAVPLGAAAFSGSCALLALYDPIRSVLRVANVGDSRAVLGRWDASENKYVAVPMSVDHTGFNEDEVARLEREHPGEAVVDPKTGRLHGLAVTRAFGDARWKWTEEVTRKAHTEFWGPAPRPNGVIKTPPYLTAEPEIMETRVQTGNHPDFLIMASDGLWDNMSSEVAVQCVQAWLDKNKPTDFLKEEERKVKTWADLFADDAPQRETTFSSPDEITGDDDTYYDEDERCRKWRVEPKHFVVEDSNCGTHLIKNALGGKRRDLFTGVMSVQPPLSRNVRDDITVHVIFFGVDAQKQFDKMARARPNPDPRAIGGIGS